MTPNHSLLQVQAPRVLVVEDSATQAAHLCHLLEANGFEVEFVSQGVAALAAMRSRRPRAVVSDVMMPEMDGYSLCRAVRADPELHDIHLILLTTLSEGVEVLRALESGADYFLTKPADEGLLVSRIRQAIAGDDRTDDDSAALVYGGRPWRIATGRRRILELLLSTYESTIRKKDELQHAHDELRGLNDRLEWAVANLVTLNEISSAIARTSGVRDLCQQFLESLLHASTLRLTPRARIELDEDGQLVEIHSVGMVGAAGSGSANDRRIGIPLLRGEGRRIGLLTVWATSDSPLAQEADHLELLTSIGAQLAVGLENARRFEQAQLDALHDALTGLPNRRQLELFFGKVFAQSKRGAFPLSVMMLDIDHFKGFNDRFGHAAGDRALAAVAHCAQQRIRSGDLIARYGGEEFLVVLPGLGVTEATLAAERLRAAVEAETQVTVSVGIATLGAEISSPATLIEAADQALYLAKEAGRNRVASHVRRA